jgi:hypothetical protein
MHLNYTHSDDDSALHKRCRTIRNGRVGPTNMPNRVPREDLAYMDKRLVNYALYGVLSGNRMFGLRS